MAKIQTGLGRGLDALISDATFLKGSQRDHGNENGMLNTAEIEIDRIEPNPYQPRTEFDQEALEELSRSISLIGLIQPITIRPVDGGRYQIISGERRYRASRLAGLRTIPAYIKDTDDNGMLEMAIVENVQREDLDPIEIAVSFRRLMEECNLTQEAMSERVGKKRATVANYLRLLNLPAEIQLAIKAKKLTMGHAKSLLGLENDKDKLKIANLIIEKDLSVRDVEARVRKMNEPRPARAEKQTMELTENHFRIVETLGRYFDNNVSIKRDENGAGSITIRFSSDEQINSFTKALDKGNLLA
ncbi:MAG: ParB/RepB/Spo0J family partition protein [Bacteroidetes bacterium]|uniref:ParB/RepB/Spo0J family partition protein n=1 Tax=Candidatus Egerieousia excrementavium TaxID=2840778 RepID=A0A9D9DPW0_9BACT|nr:ParB/RepB/Spo0J family partition protein [Candidatus Egerieousia excrementavium]